MKKEFKIVRGLELPNKISFNVRTVIDQFSIDTAGYQETFEACFDLPDVWNVGLIVGRSGTGKTTVLKELFPEACKPTFLNPALTVIDSMPEDCKPSEITQMFNSVGFSSPPSWLKPYPVLSNGEKMRVQLAFALLSKNEVTAFDEFTSVVDRQVAKIASHCVQKAVRKHNQKFVACSCHYDVQEWLQPDWIFNTDLMKFENLTDSVGLKKNRPVAECEIYRAFDKTEAWNAFKKYHYLSHSHNNAADVYTLYLDGSLCGFFSVLNFPHPVVKKAVRAHRVVVLPDFQGMGLGLIMADAIAAMYVERGYRFFFTTTSPAIVNAFNKSKNWYLKRAGRKGKSKSKNQSVQHLVKYDSESRFTTGWEFKL